MDLPESIEQFLKKTQHTIKAKTQQGLEKLPFSAHLLRYKRALAYSAIGLAVLIAGTAIFYAATEVASKGSMRASLAAAETPEALGAFPLTVPTMRYGFAIDTFQVRDNTIQSGEFLADILLREQLDYPSIEKLVANAKDVFDVRHFRVGKPYTLLADPETEQAAYMVYEPNDYEYVLFELQGDFSVQRHEREVEVQQGLAAGTLESSLWNAIVGQGLSYELASKMEDALQWSIDFHHLQKNDEFRLVYDRNLIEGKEVGIGSVQAAYYKTGSNEYYAIHYKSEDGKHEGYYDLEGRPMKRGFLKAPVKYSRISSYYNLNRFHPILKRTRPHFGTDYAAPHGTPIYAVGDGVVIAASYTNGNGNFVKIKHDDTYQTQYLHMQKFADGIRSGAHVKQGQIIGYVGSTGLATGPHVCFRFWKDGKQVNHLNLKFPPSLPLPASELPVFGELRDQYLQQLEQAAPTQPSPESGAEEDQAQTTKEEDEDETSNP